jgi:hypothetical protein
MELPREYKSRWPGPIDMDRDCISTYLDRAADAIGAYWEWDNSAASKAIAQRCHPWQIELLAVKVAHGELLNGGFPQFLTNSYGELAEEAASGFAHFGFPEVHQVFNDALSHFPRPISKDRVQRINMLHQRFDPEKPVFDTVEEWLEKQWRAPMNVDEMAAPTLDPYAERYFSLINMSGDDYSGRHGFEILLCIFVDRHKDIFWTTA